MCTGAEPLLIGAALAAAGTGVQQYSKSQTERKQDQAAAQAIINQGRKRDAANQDIKANIKSLQSSSPQSDINQQVQAYNTAIQNATPQANAGLSNVAGASKRYAEDVGSAKAAAQTTALQNGALQARVDAPTLQRQREQNMMANTQSDLARISAESQAQQFLDKLKMQSIQNNPWMMAAGSALQGAGSAYAAAPAKVAGTGAGIYADNGLQLAGGYA